MGLEDKLLPHVVGCIDDEGSIMIGWKKGSFYLMSVGFQGDLFVVEEVLYQDNWDNFLTAIEDHFDTGFVKGMEDLSLGELESADRDDQHVHSELIRRGQKALSELNDINRMIARCGLDVIVKTYDQQQVPGYHKPHIGIRYMKEQK